MKGTELSAGEGLLLRGEPLELEDRLRELARRSGFDLLEGEGEGDARLTLQQGEAGWCRLQLPGRARLALALLRGLTGEKEREAALHYSLLPPPGESSYVYYLRGEAVERCRLTAEGELCFSSSVRTLAPGDALEPFRFLEEALAALPVPLALLGARGGCGYRLVWRRGHRLGRLLLDAFWKGE